MCRSLLVPHQYVTDARVVELVVDWKNLAAGIAENRIDTLLLERLDQGFRAGYSLGFIRTQLLTSLEFDTSIVLVW